MQLIKLFDEENVGFDFQAADKNDALEKLSKLVCKNRPFLNYEKVLDVLIEREKLGSTGIGNEVAIPHGKMNIDESLVGAIAISKTGVEFESIDKQPVRIIIVLIASKQATHLHLKILAKISRFLMDDNFREKLKNIKSFSELKNILPE